MELASKYEPQEVESKWYQYWLDNKLFSSKPDNREPYTVVIPPPNVTGVLHMGHMLNNTIQDILVRRARMEGKNACWVPGTDHASIATEAKVVNRLAQQGIKKTDLSRDEFLQHAWDWTHEHGDIIFFWVARMIMAGYEYRGKMPFKNVYFTGIVRDKLGRKMSKSLGNSPDPLDLIDKYGADGVRMGMMLSAPAGNDILFDESLCEQGRNFNNKIWNAFRLVKGWEVADEAQPKANKIAVEWFAAKLRLVNEELNDQFSKYRISEALMLVYRLFGDEFSSWFLEMVKPAYGSPIDRETFNATLQFFDALLKMLHPFMPFITEELWQHLYERTEGDSIMREKLVIATPTQTEKQLAEDIEAIKLIVSGVRMVRNQKNISPKEQLTLNVLNRNRYADYNEIIVKMANLQTIEIVEEKVPDAAQFMVGTDEFAVPVGNLIDIEAEIKKQEAQLAHLEGFLAGIKKKLANEKFVAHAPEAVVALERKKQSDSEEKIAALKESIAELKKK